MSCSRGVLVRGGVGYAGGGDQWRNPPFRGRTWRAEWTLMNMYLKLASLLMGVKVDHIKLQPFCYNTERDDLSHAFKLYKGYIHATSVFWRYCANITMPNILDAYV